MEQSRNHRIAANKQNEMSMQFRNAVAFPGTGILIAAPIAAVAKLQSKDRARIRAIQNIG